MHQILELVKSRSVEGPREEFSVKKITFLQISYFGKKWGRVQVIWNRLVELWLLECIFGDLWHWVVSTWWEAPEVEEHTGAREEHTRAPPERNNWLQRRRRSPPRQHQTRATLEPSRLVAAEWKGNASAPEQFMKTAGSTKESALETFLSQHHSIQKSQEFINTQA